MNTPLNWKKINQRDLETLALLTIKQFRVKNWIIIKNKWNYLPSIVSRHDSLRYMQKKKNVVSVAAVDWRPDIPTPMTAEAGFSLTNK